MELLMFLLLVLLVDLAALKWGADSREGRDLPLNVRTRWEAWRRSQSSWPLWTDGVQWNVPDERARNEYTDSDFRTTDNSDTRRDRRFWNGRACPVQLYRWGNRCLVLAEAAGTKAVAAIECSLCATGSSSSGWS